MGARCTPWLALAALLALLAPAHGTSARVPTIKLNNRVGMSATFIPTGASVVELIVPGAKLPRGRQPDVNVVLGYSNLTDYPKDPHPSFGAICGRVCNRISNASFTLDGKTYKLLANDGTSTIHGGATRYSKVSWAYKKENLPEVGEAVVFTRNGVDEGFPGNLSTTVRYFLPINKTRIEITITATTTAATPINIVQHTYFNLKGAGQGTILDHVIQMGSQFYTPAPEGDLVPTGQVSPVAGTPYDLTKPVVLSKVVPLANGGKYKGFDTNFVLPRQPATAAAGTSPQWPVWWLPYTDPSVTPANTAAPLTVAGRVREPKSGRTLTVSTDAPGAHLYTGNFLPEQAGPSRDGAAMYPQYGGFCLETQAFPNAINTPTFPWPVLRPGQVYTRRIVWDFAYTNAK